jgi:peptide/nickel transport system substrate-binding protein
MNGDPTSKELGLTRRELMKRVGLAAAATTAGAFLVACRPDDAARSSLAPGPVGTAGSNVKPGGELRYTMLAFDPRLLDPHQSVFGEDIYSTSLCYNNLVYFNWLDKPPYTIDPDLAESWEVSKDGKQYTFHLAKNVTFHDGMPFTAADAKYSLDRVRNPTPGMVSPRQGQLEMVDSVEAPDQYTLVVKLRTPSTSFLPFLAQDTMPIVPKHLAEKDELKGKVIGTGPFKWDRWDKGQALTYVKNEKYFKPGLPYLDRVTRYIFQDTSLAQAAFVSGRVDFMGRRAREMTRSELKDIQSRVPNIVSKPSGEMTETRFIMNDKRDTPLKDPRVRQAIALWVDKKAVFDVVFDGFGTVHGIVPPWDPGALPQDRLAKIAGFGSDVQANRAEAKKLFAAAGVPNGFQIKAPFTLKSQSTEVVSVAIMNQLREAGITGTLQSVDTDTYYARGATGDWDILLGANSYTTTDIESVMRDYFTPKAGRNWGGINGSAEADALFDQYLSELDPAKRKEIAYRLQEAIMQKNVYIPIGTPGGMYVAWPYVKNYAPPYTQSTYDNMKFERVWLDK